MFFKYLLVKLKVILLFFLFIIFIPIPKGIAGGVNPNDLYKKVPKSVHGAPSGQNTIKFTENKNQWDKKVLYRAQLDGGVLFLEKNCFTYNFYDKETLRKNHIRKQKQESGDRNTEKNSVHIPDLIRMHAFRMTFVNADKAVEVTEKNPTTDYCNFFIGNDQSKWAGNVKNYKEVNYQNIYAGIDLQILGLQNSLKYNFIVAPNGNINDIALLYEGLESIALQKGALFLKTTVNELVEQKPYAYQTINGKRVEVPCEFVLNTTTVSFLFPKGYDQNYELVIDPILVFACSSGSLADNFGMTATYDNSGNLYSGGTVFGAGYPTSVGAFDTSWNGAPGYLAGRTDVVISKYDASGTFMQYSTYLGGNTSTEIVSSLVVNAQNELMIYGATGSSDFPVTVGAYNVTCKGGSYLSFPSNGTEYINGTDLYVTKFNSTGTGLIASTYIGGTQNEGVNDSPTLAYNYGDYYRGEIQTDNLGNCYIASCTYSSDFPTTAGCSQPVAGGGMDGVVFKMNPTLSTMMWSTYVGGSADDGCYALTLDNSSNVYTTGGTSSTNFPTTAGVLDTTYNGGITDGFITKIKNNGSMVMKSTFVGTASYDQSFLIQCDSHFNVYIVGQSQGSMPVSIGVYSNPNGKQFIWKVDSLLSTQVFTTIFGSGTGQVDISPSAFLVDICNNIYVSGWGGNVLTSVPTTNMPVTANAFQPNTDGFNFYLCELSPNATSLLYGTYFGGGLSREHVDGGTSRFDKKGIVYQAVCAGCGGNDDFPVTAGSWPNTGGDVNHNTQNFNCNQGVFKFDFQATGVTAQVVTAPNDTICTGSPVTFNNTSTNAFNYIWVFGDGSPPSTTPSPSHVYTAPGVYSVMLIAIDSSGCIFSDTANLVVVVVPPPSVTIGPDLILCQTPNVTLDAGTSASTYIWSTGATSQTIVATAIGAYWVKIDNGVCSDSDTMNIQQVIKPSLGNDTTLCAGQQVSLSAPSGGISYQWSTGNSSQTISVSASGQYWVTVNWGACQTSDTVDITLVPAPIVNLPASVSICPHDSVQLNPGNNTGATYLWSTGDDTQTITVSSAGTYTVKVTNQQCSIWDTTVVIGVPPYSWEKNVKLCNVEKYRIDAGISGASYHWSTGDTTQYIDVTASGVFWVVMNTHGCPLTDTVTVDGSFGSGELWFPNSFTPNEDQLNDCFSPKGTDITEFEMLIFNRWGELIFETEKLDKCWNGIYNGTLVQQDVYVWKVKYKTVCSKDLLISKIGRVSVVR